MIYRLSKKTNRIHIRVDIHGVCTVVVPYRKNSFLQNSLIQKAKLFFNTSQDAIQKATERMNRRRIKQVEQNKCAVLDFRQNKNSSSMSKEEMKMKTQGIVHTYLREYNAYYKYTYNKIFVKHMKSRWGSCSRLKNLNFNSKLCLLKDEQIRYVVVHELCHLKEFNHGQSFWNLIQETIPNFKAIRRSMKYISI